MPIRIFHPDHGYVITSDQAEIEMLINKGGVMDKPKEQPKEQNFSVTPQTKMRGRPRGTR